MEEQNELQKALERQKSLVTAFASQEYPNGRPIDIFHNGKVYFAKLFMSKGVVYAVSGGDTKDKVVKDVVLHNGKRYAKTDLTHKINVLQVLKDAAVGEIVVCRT